MRAIACLLVFTCCSYTHADSLPSYLNTNQTTRNLPVPNLPTDAYRPAAAPLQVSQPAASADQPLTMGTTLTIRKLQIEGGTRYPLSEVGKVYQPLLGHPITVGELIEATGQVTKAGKSLIFVRGQINTGERLLMTFSGVIRKFTPRA